VANLYKPNALPQKNIHLIFKNHLDIGFTDLTSNVRKQYHDHFMPLAIATDEIYFAPRHPYSSALLGAVLIPEYNAKKASREPLQGQPPNPANLPEGCPFAPRCAFASDICRQVQPEIEDDGNGRLTACHRKNEISLTGVKL
jgi:oligopeptide/dipeptide ABC transporter ATP-binding protein